MAMHDEPHSPEGDAGAQPDYSNWCVRFDHAAAGEQACVVCDAAPGVACRVDENHGHMMHAERSPGWAKTARNIEEARARAAEILDEDQMMQLWNSLDRGDTFDEAMNTMQDDTSPVGARRLWDKLIEGYERDNGRPYPGPRSEWSEEYRTWSLEWERRQREISAAAWREWKRDHQAPVRLSSPLA